MAAVLANIKTNVIVNEKRKKQRVENRNRGIIGYGSATGHSYRV